MAKEINVQETIQSDFSVVVNDIAEDAMYVETKQRGWCRE